MSIYDKELSIEFICLYWMYILAMCVLYLLRYMKKMSSDVSVSINPQWTVGTSYFSTWKKLILRSLCRFTFAKRQKGRQHSIIKLVVIYRLSTNF